MQVNYASKFKTKIPKDVSVCRVDQFTVFNIIILKHTKHLNLKSNKILTIGWNIVTEVFSLIQSVNIFSHYYIYEVGREVQEK